MAETFPDDILLDLQIFVDKVGAVDTVCHDAANEGSSKEYIFRLFFIEKLADRYTVEQVKLLVSAAYQIRVSFILQIFPDSRTHETVVSCYIYFCILFHSSV